MKETNSNMFDIIRHIAAISVIFSHNYVLHGVTEPSFNNLSIGGFAVLTFFSISGYLIAQSYTNAESNFEYLKKRVLRIFPGLSICLVFTIYICCGIFGRDDFINWISSTKPLHPYFHFLLLKGVSYPESYLNYFTSDYIYKNSINGSLWTLFFEVLDYVLILVFLGFFKIKTKGAVIFLLGAILMQLFCIIFKIHMYYIVNATFLSIAFSGGAVLFLTQHYWKENRNTKLILTLASILLIATSTTKEIFYPLLPLGWTILVLITSISFKDKIIKRKFDLSYGIYIRLPNPTNNNKCSSRRNDVWLYI
ncbi:acyltransferase family protein [Dickeya fangzhongdai]|uniref:acyltransferase family protein n=1 Tax=Dickeya fangzhongdai TaxID=1778540 RepID=UPI0026DF943B|nr:acyltransferase [Dickeya fangzhongdai]WKV50147.1 acyltransferase [Dickeya fangzhongdai]